MSRFTIKKIQNQKNIKPIACVSTYTSDFAKIIDKYVDIILVGDSLGTAIYGMKNTQSVTLDMMQNHGRAVCNSTSRAFTIVDMPYNTYTNKRQALKNAQKLINYTKCQSIKLETDEKNIDIVKYLVKHRIKVVSHIGVTPQKYKNFSKIRYVGKTTIIQNKIIKLAQKLEEAGTCLIVLECMQDEVAKKITDQLGIPTIGIGASINCDGQILIINDILNTDPTFKKPRFIKSYSNLSNIIGLAVKKYTEEVVNKKFPKLKNAYR